MTTLLITHDVEDVDHWLASPKREEFFGPLGITVRTFVDAERSTHVGLIAEVPDLAAVEQAMNSPKAAKAMKQDGVLPETIHIMATSSDLMQRFTEGIAAVNARDWTRQRSLLADTMTYIDYGTGMTMTGADAFVASQRDASAPFPDQQMRITAIAECGPTVLAELVVEGTHTGDLPLPTGGTLPATGKKVAVHVSVVTEYAADGRATSCRAYNNPMELLGQLGVAPAIPQQITLDAPSPARAR